MSPKLQAMANHTHGLKGNAVGVGTKNRASKFPWRGVDLPSQEKAAGLLTGGGVSECKSPSGPHTRVTAAQSRDGPSAKSLLQERTSHSTWERCSQVQRLLNSDTWRHLQTSSCRAQTLTSDPSTTKKTMIFNLPDLVAHQVLTTNPSSKAGWITDLTL